MIWRSLRLIVTVLLLLPIMILMFYGTAFIGGLIPNPSFKAHPKAANDTSVDILLIAGPIHYDLLLPATPVTRARIEVLAQGRLAAFDPNTRYFSVGWGSEAFYTSAGDYTDVTFRATFRAVTGDHSVMRVFALGDLYYGPNLDRVALSREGYTALLDFIDHSFTRNAQGQTAHVEGATLGINDVFFKSPHHFNILTPCNVWVADALAHSGIRVGWGTPTPQSLYFSLWWFDSLTLQS